MKKPSDPRRRYSYCARRRREPARVLVVDLTDDEWLAVRRRVDEEHAAEIRHLKDRER
jgi:hypothetical protein